MKLLVFGILFGLSTTPAYADNSFELLRISVTKKDGKIVTRSDCKISADWVTQTSSLGEISTNRSLSVAMSWDDAAQVQWLVDAAEGLTEPHAAFETARRFTNWWVRSGPWDSFKLVRTHIVDAYGKSNVQNSEYTLPTFMGMNCFTSFSN